MPPAKPKLAQVDWDEAVRTNIDDFDMSPEEAVQAAAEEFDARYDLSSVLRAADGAAAAASHPAALAAGKLRKALEGSDDVTVDAAIAELATACFPADEKDRQPALAVADKEGAAKLLLDAAAAAGTTLLPLRLPALRLLRRLLMRSADARAAFLAASGVERCTDWLAGLLLAPAAGCAADKNNWPGVAAIIGCCEAACYKSEEAKCRFASYVPPAGPLSLPTTTTASAPCPDEEQAAAVGAGGFVSLLLGGVLASGSATAAAVCAAAGVLRSLTYADDDTALASRAFTHARLLAKSHGALRGLLSALQRLSAEAAKGEEEAAVDATDDADALPSTRAEAVAAVMAAVRSVAANDDACRGFSDDGGVRACLDLLRRGVVASGGGATTATATTPQASSAALARSAAGALRQLANSDPVKTLLAEDGALDVIVDALGRFSGGRGGGGGSTGAATTKAAASDDVAPAADDDDETYDDDDAPTALPEVLEPVAGLLAAMTLRQPGVAARAADAGAVAALCQALGRLTTTTTTATAAVAKKGLPAANGTDSAAACRQLCMAVRNMAGRGGDELRAAFLARGAEPLLRAAKSTHPAACGDVGSAALRDLGLDNYNA